MNLDGPRAGATGRRHAVDPRRTQSEHTFDPGLVRAAASHPRYDFSAPASVRKRMQRNIAVVESAGLWRRQDPAVHWVDQRVCHSGVLVRVYRRVGVQGQAPAVIYFHGGGFVTGDLDTEHPRCLEMCRETSATVVSVDYRLAPEHPFPAALDDCDLVFDWAMRHGAEWNLDVSRIAIAGASAGGCLANATLLRRRARGEPMPSLQMLIYPVLDDRMATGSMLSCENTPVWDRSRSALMWEHYLGPVGQRGAVSPLAAPARVEHVGGVPRTYVLAAEHDPLRDEALEYAQRLVQAGVPVESHLFSGTFHGFDTLGDSMICRRARQEQYAVIRDALRIPDTTGPAKGYD